MKRIKIVATLMLCSQVLTPLVGFAETTNESSQTIVSDQLESTSTSQANETETTAETNLPEVKNETKDTLPPQSTDIESPAARAEPVVVAEEASDASVTPEVIITSDNTSSLDSPLSPGNYVVYNVVINNNDTQGNIVPAGTKIKFTIEPVEGVAATNILSFINISTANRNDFTTEQASDGVTLTLVNDMYPGSIIVNVNFLVKNPGYNWDGLDNKTDPAVASATVKKSVIQNDGTTTAFDSDQIYVKPSKYSNPGNPGTAGWTASGNAGKNDLNNAKYPDDQDSVKSGAVYLQNPYNLSTDGSKFFSYYGNFQPRLSSNPGTGGLFFQSDLPFDTSANTLYFNGKDVSNEPGVVWNISEDKKTVEVVFSDYMLANGITSGNFDARVYVPVTDINAVNVVYTACRSYPINGTIATQGGWTYTTMFQSINAGTTIPYFRGSDKTIYDTDEYNALSDVYAYTGSTNITSSITVTDYDGYPTDGKHPASGVYTIKYNVTNSDGESNQFSRQITVKENKQAITGSDYSMYIGDNEPTAADFKASATDKDGNALDVTANLSSADLSEAGTYNVVLSATDGQSKTVKLTVKENKQSIDGSDYAMYVGDKEPTVTDFNASATDKDGNAVDVTADFSAVDFAKAGTYDVVLSAADGQNKTVTLTVKENKQAINGSDFTMYVGDKEPTVTDFNASATDKDGNAIDVTADFSAVDFAKPGTYDVVLSAADGQIKTVKLTVKENKQSIDGSDYAMYVGDKEPTVTDFNASATDKDGNAVDLTADFSAVDFAKAGTYDVVLTAADGQTKTVTLTVKENKQAITGSDYTMYVGDKEPTATDFNASATDRDGHALEVTADLSGADLSKAGTYDVVLSSTDGQTKTVDLIVKENKQSIDGSDYAMFVGDAEPTLADFDASATDKDGNAIDVTADLSKVDFAKAGTYDVVLTAADGQTKTVTLTVKEDKQAITGSDYTMYVGDKEPTATDFNASATDRDGHALEVTADLSGADLSKAGTYDVVLSSTDGQTKTVDLIVKENKQSIDGSDYAMYVGDKKPTSADFNASATDKDGNAVDVTPDFSAVDFAKAGTYDVVLTAADGQTKTVKLTIKDKDASDPVGNNSGTTTGGNSGTGTTPGNIARTNTAATSNANRTFPKTGEQSSNALYVMGTALLALAGGLFIWIKKSRRTN